MIQLKRLWIGVACHLLMLCPIFAEKAVDLTVLEHAAVMRAAACRKSLADERAGTEDLLVKGEGYESTLRTLWLELRKTYYQHAEFPADPCAAIDDYAKLIVGLEYPLAEKTGASGYEWALVETKIRLLEDAICRMSRKIFERVHRDAATHRPTKQAETAYAAWLKKWNDLRAR